MIACICLGVGETAAAIGIVAALGALWRKLRKARGR